MVYKVPKEFWRTFLNFSKIKYNGSSKQVCHDFNKMPGAEWFPDVVPIAQNLLNFQGDKVAIRFFGENIVHRELTYTELFNEVKIFL